MEAHPESELHRCGKMFGVLLCKNGYLAAFSAKLDGSYEHEGFVGPIYTIKEPLIGTSKEESQRLQRLLFTNYNFLNRKGERKNLIEIFEKEKPILSADEWFNGKKASSLPPAGAGECCAPKLLQAAFLQGLEPVELAEFWVGAAPKNEIRQEGAFYAPCSGRCGPILRHMLVGLEVKGERLKEKGDIVIPANCVLLKPEGATVWVAEDGKAARRFVTVDGYQADGVRITQGLQEGDILITEGYQKLYNGCAVDCTL